ncbi:short chain dehydrogenase [Fragilaria crotonensis]|nr:short chain dehydrogenase [Fragilaria crotonensis]
MTLNDDERIEDYENVITSEGSHEAPNSGHDKSNPSHSPLVPQLPDNITEYDLTTAIRVLNSVASLNHKKNKKKRKADDDEVDEGLEAYKQPNLRAFRKALAQCLELHKKTMFNGKSEEIHYEHRKEERSLKRQKMAESQQQKKYIAETALRKGRVERLQQLKEDAKEEEHARLMAYLVPDGHVESVPRLLENDNENNVNNGNDDGDDAEIKLPKLRSCYVCKVRYRDLHHFYDQLCPTCAPFNWQKRHQTVRVNDMDKDTIMTNKVAVVTGARVKIGYQVCLKLLRAGATVVATTRFPNAAAAMYQQEDDFEDFKDRLQVYGLDLRDVTGIEAFTRFLKIKYAGGIDIIINNACQTVRRPTGYYLPMLEKEQSLWSAAGDVHKQLLVGCAEFEDIRRKLVIEHTKMPANKSIEYQQEHSLLETEASESTTSQPASDTISAAMVVETVSEPSVQAPFHSTGISHSSAMSQMIILPEDAGVSDDILPPGVSDINGQQLDLRHTNSWLLKMEEVSTPEIMECMFINAIAPFVLNSRLKPLMTTPNDDSRPDRFIINVSAMEGKFYRYKMPNHPHTNMAKAALNMMTRTSADDLAKQHRIYMNSVDTGWINDENPLEKASKIAKTNLFQTPIDEIDAAARILDPVFSGIEAGREGEKVYGKFLKDYRETEW